MKKSELYGMNGLILNFGDTWNSSKTIGNGYNRAHTSICSIYVAKFSAYPREFVPFQLSCMVKNGGEAVVHLMRRLHEIYGDTHVIFY